MDEPDTWLSERPNVDVFVADRPTDGADWRAQAGWGWTVKAWFASSHESRQAMARVRAEGWEPEPKRWGRRLRVRVSDGYEGQRLADFVLSQWPRTRIQLRND